MRPGPQRIAYHRVDLARTPARSHRHFPLPPTLIREQRCALFSACWAARSVTSNGCPALLLRSRGNPGIVRRVIPYLHCFGCTRTARTGGLDQHVQGGAQVGVRVDDVRPGAGVVAVLLGPFRHRSQRLPGRKERGLQRDADVTVGRAHTRPPTREHQDGCRTRPKASARGTARVGSRFPRTSPSRSSPDPRPRRTRGHLRPPRRGP